MTNTTVTQPTRTMPTDPPRAAGAMVPHASSVPEVITDPRDYVERERSLRERFHIIAAPPLGAFAPGFTLQATVLQIDPAVDDKGNGAFTYFSKFFMKWDEQRANMNLPWCERALGSHALKLVSQYAGIEWDLENTGRVDDCATPWLWQYRALGHILRPDGRWLSLPPGETEIDLRDGSPQTRGMSAAQISSARSHGLKLAATKARQIAIRNIGVQQKYTVAELQKPFLIFRAVFQPDLSDPQVRLAYNLQHMQGRRLLYAGAAPIPSPALTAPSSEMLAPVPPAGTLDTPASGLAPASTSGSAATARSAPKGQKVVRVERVVHNNQPIDMWDIGLDDGRVARTDDGGTQETAEKARQLGWIVDVTMEPSQRRQGAFVVVELVKLAEGAPLAATQAQTLADLY